MSHDCRVVTISTNQIMLCVMAEFPFAASREFLFRSVFIITRIKQLNNIIFFAKKHVPSIDGILVRVRYCATGGFDARKMPPPQTRGHVLAKFDRNPFLSTSSCYIIQLISSL